MLWTTAGAQRNQFSKIWVKPVQPFNALIWCFAMRFILFTLRSCPLIRPWRLILTCELVSLFIFFLPLSGLFSLYIFDFKEPWNLNFTTPKCSNKFHASVYLKWSSLLSWICPSSVQGVNVLYVYVCFVISVFCRPVRVLPDGCLFLYVCGQSECLSWMTNVNPHPSKKSECQRNE